MRSLLLVVLLFSLSGCSAMSMVKGMFTSGSGVSVDTELVLGDKEVKTELQVGDVQTATTIHNTDTVSPFMLVLMALGWLLPDPGSMCRGIKDAFKKKE